MLLLLFLQFGASIIPKELLPLANKALKNVKYRKLMTESKIHMLQPGSYETNGAQFRISKALFGPPAKEIKGYAYEKDYLAIVPNIKYNISQNLLDTTFALNQKMYILQNISGSDEQVSIYQVKEINPHNVITEIIMYTADENSTKSHSKSTLTKIANFNWNEKENAPIFRPLISKFQNLKFGMGTTLSASASAKLHSRGTNYLQLDLTFKVEGSFGAGIQTVAGHENPEDHALYENEIQIWGLSLNLFGFEFKSGLFAYIDAAIKNINLDTAIDFTFMQGYTFEAYNRIIVCTGFPSPGYTTTGWQSKAEKIDIINQAKQNGSQESYQTVLKFTPGVDIGVKLGLELPGSTSSWLKAGIRGEINFEFGGDPVSCSFPYLFGKVEPVISLFIGYEGLKILGFEVAPPFEVVWELYKKTVFSKECAFLDVKVSPSFITDSQLVSRIPSAVVQIDHMEGKPDKISIPIYRIGSFSKEAISVFKLNQTSDFKPIVFANNHYDFVLDSMYKENNRYYICGTDPYDLTDDNGLISIDYNYFKGNYTYKKVPQFYTDDLIFYEKDEFSFIINTQGRYALLQANLTGGFSILKNSDVEFWDDTAPNEGYGNCPYPFSYFYYGSGDLYYDFETKEDLGEIKIDVYIKYRFAEDMQYYCTIYHIGIGTPIVSLLTKNMGYDILYIFYIYVNGTLIEKKDCPSDWFAFKHKLIVFSMYNQKSIYLKYLYESSSRVFVKIKRDELIGPKRYSLVPVVEVEFHNTYYPEENIFPIKLHAKYFVLLLNLGSWSFYDKNFKPDEIENLTNFAMLLKCPGCFPISKYCETIDNGYYLIKLTLNETIDFSTKNQIISIPMCNVEGGKLDTKFQITHFFTLNNEGSSQCKHNASFKREKMGDYHGTFFKYACLTPKSEELTWNASYENPYMSSKFRYNLTKLADIENRDQVLISFEIENPFNQDILVTKDYYNYPINASFYTRPDAVSLYKADRCKRLYVYKNKEEIELEVQFDGKFYYDPKTSNNDADNEVDFVCVCHNNSDSFCETKFHTDKMGYYLFESLSPDGITITRNDSTTTTYPYGKIKREIVKMNNPDFYYTKTWEGELNYYLIKEDPDTYKITVSITAPKDKLDYRKIQLYVDGDNFSKYPIGFDVIKYMDDPSAFLNNLGIDTKSNPALAYFGDDLELYVSIDAEPKFNNDWCALASKMSQIPQNSLSSSYTFDCGDGMKWKKGVCIVDHKLSWKFWVIIAAIIVAFILLVVLIIFLIRKCCC